MVTGDQTGRSSTLIETLDIILRNASTGIFLMMAVLIIRDYGWRLGPVLGSLSSITAASYTLCTQAWFDWHGAGFSWMIIPFCVLGPIYIWLFSLSQFQDDFRLKNWHWAVVVSYVVLTQVGFEGFEGGRPIVEDLLYMAFSGLRFALIGHMLFVAWQGRADDLLETRRRFRTIYIVLVGFVMTVISVLETFYQTHQSENWIVSFFQASGFFALAAVILWHATKVRDGILLVNQTSGERKAKVEARADTRDPADQHDLDAIDKLVVGEQMYLEQGLTIAKLAEAAKLPEHRLRRLINQHMGYRNFADFLNRYRIEEAQKRLSDAENRHTQVLVIAMDLGYGSLGPFNRAFKARTGQTPTEFRKQALSD